jgi:hypothetical protein
MEIAIFTESYEPSMGAHRRQVLMAPHDGGVRVYSRKTDGTKGHGSAWVETDLEELVTEINPNEQLTRTPSGVYVTPLDEKAITTKGYSPVLCTKACSAHAKAGPNTETKTLVETIYDVYTRILGGDDTLDTYVKDNRSATSSTVPLIVQPVHELPTQTTAQPAFNVSLATVPPMKLAERYVHRKVYGVEDFKTFDTARAKGINVLIYGPTGPGKTTAVEAWAAERNLRMATVSGNASMESRQLFGGFIPDGNGGYGWIDGPVTDVVRNGGVLLLDEFNFISPKIYTTLYPLTDGRRTITLLDHMGETIVAHPDLTIFATMNPDYIGTTPLNFAMRNRFDIQLSWDYDDAVESKLISSKSLLLIAKQLRAEAAKGQYETPISTNMLIEIADFINDDDLGYEFAIENFIAHFSADEQPSVRLVFQTHEHNIKQDFGMEVEIELEKDADVSPEDLMNKWLTNTN